MLSLNPQTQKKLRRFRGIKRGYYSFLILAGLMLLTSIGELLVNNRALLVSYEDTWYFPTYTDFHPGTDFGLTYGYETNYRDLQQTFEQADNGDFVIMPLIPYSAFENHAPGGIYKPLPPTLELKHYLGTDTTSRDILARLFYGTRIALTFSIAFMVWVYVIGISIGCAMGYFGGVFDLIFQRLIEIWSNIPFLYTVIIVFSVIPSTFAVATRIGILLTVMVLFSWPGMTYYNWAHLDHVYIHTNARTCVGAVKHGDSALPAAWWLITCSYSSLPVSCSMVDAVLQHMMPSRLVSTVASQTPDPASAISVPQLALPRPAGGQAAEVGQRAV